MNAINKAIQTVGGQAELARRLSVATGSTVTPQTIYNWRKRGNVPPELAPYVESVTDGQARADDLCPSIPWHVIREGRAA